MTPRLINSAAQVVFLVSGSSKAVILNEVLNGPYQPDTLPAQLIKPAQGELIWLVDKEAAGKLKANPE